MTSLHWCHASQVFSSPPSISQQQNCWFSHHPSEQYPILMSESHSVAIDMSAAFTPIPMPVRTRIQHRTARHRCCSATERIRGRVRTNNSPTRLTTNQLCPACAIFLSRDQIQARLTSPRGPRYGTFDFRAARNRLFRSMIESCIQSCARQACSSTELHDISPIVVKSS